MASPDQDAQSAAEAAQFSDKAHFLEMLKEMKVDESLFKDGPQAPDEASAAPEELEAVDETSTTGEEPEPNPAKEEPAAEGPAEVKKEQALEEEEERVPEPEALETDEVEEEGKPLNFLGPGSNVEGYFEEGGEEEEVEVEEELDFTDEDLEDLPLFDDMDDDPAAVLDALPDKPPPKREPPPEPPEEPTEIIEPERDVKQDEPIETKTPVRIKLPRLKWPESISKRKAGIGAAAVILILFGAVGLYSLLSSLLEPGEGQTKETAAEAEEGQGAGLDPSADPSTDPKFVKPADPLPETGAESRPVPNEFEGKNHYADGVAMFKVGRYTEAITEFENDITSASLFLARCYQLLGENEEALKHYQRVLWEFPDRNAFIEVFALAEEMFAAGKYETARKLYYAFISQRDRMPGQVRKLVSQAYFKICRCLEEEAFEILNEPWEEEAEEESAARETGEEIYLPGSHKEGKEFVTARFGPDSKPDSSRKDPSWSAQLPARISVESQRLNSFNTLFSVECVSAPLSRVLCEITEKAGRQFRVDEDLRHRLDGEVVSCFLKDRQLEEILEYITGQVGLTYTLDETELAVTTLTDLTRGDWLAMKEEAVKAFRRSLYRFGHEVAPKAYFEISRLHYLSGDYNAAISPARTLILEYPEFSQIPIALLNIGKCYMELEDFRKAREFLTELVNNYTHHPASQEGMVLRARCLWREGNPAAAQLALRSMRQQFPDSPLRYEGDVILARILSSVQEFEPVIALLNEIDVSTVEQPGTAVSILLLKGEAFLRSGDADSAVATAEEMLKTFPGDVREKDACYLLAEAYLEQGRYFLALSACMTLKEQFPDSRVDPFLYLTAAESLKQMDLYERALQWLEEGVEHCVVLTQDTYAMYMFLGNLLFEMKKYERAKVVFKKVTECTVLEKDANVMYVRSQLKQKDYYDALRTLNDLMDRAEFDPPYKSELCKIAGDCFLALGDADAAIHALQGELESAIAAHKKRELDALGSESGDGEMEE